MIDPSSSQRIARLHPGLAILFGTVMGLLITLIPFISSRLHVYPLGFNWTPLSPFVISGFILLLAAGLLLMLTRMEAIFAHRDRFYILLLLVPLHFGGVSYGQLETAKFATLTVLFCLLIDMMVQRRPFRISPTMAFLLAGLAIFTFASMVSGGPGVLFSLHTIYFKILFFVLVINVIRTREALQFAIWVIIALGLFTAVFAIVQEGLFYLFGYTITFDSLGPRFWYKETPWVWMLRGSAFHYNSEYMDHALIMPLALALFNSVSLSFVFLSILLIGCAIFLSFSAGGWIVYFFILLIYPYVRRPAKAIHYSIFLVLALILCYETGLLTWTFKNVFLPIGERGFADRRELLQLGVQTVIDHPIFGIGLGSFSRLSALPVHNTYLQLASEIGFLGGTIFVAIIGALLVRMILTQRKVKDLSERRSTCALFLGMLGVAVHFLMEPLILGLVPWSNLALVESAILVYGQETFGMGLASSFAENRET